MDDFSSNDDGDFATPPAALLQTMLDTISVRIEVLKPVRDGKRIIDFEYIIVNESAKLDAGNVDLEGKKLIDGTGYISKNFSKLVQVIDTGTTIYSKSSLTINGSIRWFNETYLKSGGHVIILREDIAERHLSNLTNHDGKDGQAHNGNTDARTDFPKSGQKDGSRPRTNKFLHKAANVENFREVLDNSPNAVICLDLEGLIIYWNAISTTLFGFTEEEVLGKNLEVILFPEDRPLVKSKIDRVTRDVQSISNVELRSRNKSGEWADALLNIFPLKDDSGMVTACCLMVTDISKMKKIEHELEEDVHLISQVMDTTPDIIYIMDLSTREVIYCNRGVAADLGYAEQEIAKMKNPVFDIMHEEDIPAMMAHLKAIQTLDNDQIVLEIEYRLKNRNGGYTWFIDRNAVFKRNVAKVPVEKIAICQNITRRKDEEELRLTSEEIIQQAEEVVAIGSWEYDILEDNFKWSKGMYRLFNLERNEKVRPGIYLEYSKPDEYRKAQMVVNNILYDFADFEETITLIPTGQEEKIVKIKAIVQYDHQRRPVKIIGVDLDITQQVKASEAINELYDSILKKNKELHALDHEIKTFNIVAAHDYKETLQQLYTNLEYIISNDARNLSNTGKSNIRRAQSAIQRMHLLTDDINIYFKLYDLDIKLAPVDSLQTLKTVLNEYQSKLEQYNVKVEFVNLPVLLSNKELLTQLFTNLIDNAIKFRNLDVPLVIRLSHSKADEMDTISGALKNKAYEIISIADNGLGFSQEEAEKIFEIFYRRSEGKERGTGIGLAICNRIMALHEGFITAEGQPAKGATLNCYFPIRS